MSKSVRPGKSRSIYESGIEQACQARTCVYTYTYWWRATWQQGLLLSIPTRFGWAWLHRILVFSKKRPFQNQLFESNQIKSNPIHRPFPVPQNMNNDNNRTKGVPVKIQGKNFTWDVTIYDHYMKEEASGTPMARPIPTPVSTRTRRQ